MIKILGVESLASAHHNNIIKAHTWLPLEWNELPYNDTNGPRKV